MDSPSRNWAKKMARTPFLKIFALLLGVAILGGCPQKAASEKSTNIVLDEQEQLRREKKAAHLLKATNEMSPVQKIEKLVDIAHVYYDTAAGPQAWSQLIFYLLDHSNDDYVRASKELKLFAHRCPNSGDLLASCMLFYHAVLKPVRVNPNIESAEVRGALAKDALVLWQKVGLHLASLPKFANEYGVFLEAGNALAIAGRHDEAAQMWAQVEEFEVPARDEQRMNVLLKRADLIKLDGKDPEEALRLFKEVRVFQDKMEEHIPASHRAYVDAAMKELAGKS